jgi:hypothetical protein
VVAVDADGPQRRRRRAVRAHVLPQGRSGPRGHPRPGAAAHRAPPPGVPGAPDDWDDGGPISTWEAYARDVPPEVPGPGPARTPGAPTTGARTEEP